MKKLIIIASIILAIFASLPVIGNKLVKSELDRQIQTLNSYGLEVQKEKTNIKYLSTKSYYEFVVNDANKFTEYLSKISNIEIPPNIDSVMEGMVFGANLEYNNIPISDSVSLDIYPMKLSKNIMDSIANEDNGFAKYLDEFLRGGGIMYHIDYKIVNKDFSGYIKDIDESYTFKGKEKLKFVLKGFSFVGEGVVIAPETLNYKVERIILDAKSDEGKIIIDVKDAIATSVFESRTTYKIDSKIESFDIDIYDKTNKKNSLTLINPYIYFDSSTKEKKSEV